MRFGEITISGNVLIPTAEIKNSISAKKGQIYSSKIISEDMKKIIDLYKKKGFYNVIVKYPKIITASPQNIKVVYKIMENPRLKIKKVIFEGNKYVPDKLLKENIDKNFYLSELPSKINNLVAYLNELGYFFASVKVKKTVKINQNELSVILKLDEGDFCEFNKFVFRGNKVTSDKNLLKVSGLNEVKKITPRILKIAAENISRQNYIKNCTVLPINKNEILIDVEENKMNYFNGIAGYNNKMKKGEKLSGFLNFSFLNIAGEGRAVNFKWKNIPSKVKFVSISYNQPYIGNYPIGFDANFEREEKNYIKTETGWKIFLNKINYKYGFSFYYLYIYSKGGDNYFKPEKNIKPGFWGEANFTDSFFYPSKGYRFLFHYYLILGNKKKQAIESAFEKFFPLKRDLVLFGKIATNLVQNKELSEYDYFHLGGLNNLRGYLDDSFFGYIVAWSNLELRYLAEGKSTFFFFTDWGYVKNLDTTRGKLFGMGIGMRLATKIGIFEFDYGLGLQDGRLRNPMNGIIHFGISSGI